MRLEEEKISNLNTECSPIKEVHMWSSYTFSCVGKECTFNRNFMLNFCSLSLRFGRSRLQNSTFSDNGSRQGITADPAFMEYFAPNVVLDFISSNDIK